MSTSSEFGWMDRAACRGTDDPNQFVYQLPGEVEGDRMARAGRAVEDYCMACPVAERCLAFAQKHDYSGVWGGLLLFEGNPQLLPGVTTPRVEPRPCGTLGGWARHQQEGTKPCRPCHLARVRDLQRATADPCGTTNAYRNHYRRGEKPCDKCRRAESLRWRNRSPKEPAEPVEAVAL